MFHGSMVALVTPMLEDGSLDFDSLDRLIEFHVENKTDAIVAVGTTGESATLDEKEHCTTIKRAVKTAAGRIPIIAGTGSNSTKEAIDLTRCAMEAGADACLLVTPYYNKPTQEGLYLHYRAVAEAVGIPQILYNVPGRTAVDMQPETVARLADIPNIVGIKEATGDLQRAKTILEMCGDKIDVYSGDDSTAMDLIFFEPMTAPTPPLLAVLRSSTIAAKSTSFSPDGPIAATLIFSSPSSSRIFSVVSLVNSPQR